MKESVNNFLILVYGTPGSGKSTFAEKLKTFFPSALKISIDNVESSLAFGNKKAVSTVEHILEFYRSLEQKKIEKAEFNPEIWK